MRLLFTVFVVVSGFGFLNVSLAKPSAVDKAKHGFTGEISDYPYEAYVSAWKTLNEIYKTNLPPVIKIVKHDFGDGTSRFRADTKPVSVWIDPKTYESGIALSVIVHESAHLAHWRATDRGENEYAASYFNEFRFIDEGFANIVGDRATGREEVYKRRVGAAVFLARKAKHLSLRDVENWHRVPLSNDSPGRFNPDLPSYFNYDYSYEVGSSFLYYLDSIVTTSRIADFIADYGKTTDLARSLANIYGDVLSNDPHDAKNLGEAGWHAYVDLIAFEPQAPRIVSLFPAEESKETACNELNEIIATFDQPMNTSIIALNTTVSSQYGIDYQSAKWMSDRRLVISVNKKKLVPGVRIELSLGYDGPQGHYPLKSDVGAAMAVTPWSFTCVR